MELSSHDDHCACRRPVCLFTAVGKQNGQNCRTKQGSRFKCRGPRGSRLWARLFLCVCVSCSVTHTQSGLHAVLGLCGSNGILTECKALHTKLHLSQETSIDEGGRGLSTMKHPHWTCIGRALERSAEGDSGTLGGRGEMASKEKMSRGRWLVGDATDQEDSQFALRWSEVSPVKLVCVSFFIVSCVASTSSGSHFLFALDVLTLVSWQVLADGLATCIERSFTYPLDLLRTRVQMDKSSDKQVCHCQQQVKHVSSKYSMSAASKACQQEV